MPYRHSHYYVGFVLLVIMLGFWASYWSIAASVRGAFHVHAVSAMAWLSLLIVQSVSIQRRLNAFHKQMGLASLVLFPFLILGLVMIIDVAGQRYAAQESAFVMHNSPAFGIGTAIAIAAYLTLFYQALKNRRRVKVHAGYMLATPLILFESPFSRVMESYLPCRTRLRSATAWSHFSRSRCMSAIARTARRGWSPRGSACCRQSSCGSPRSFRR